MYKIIAKPSINKGIENSWLTVLRKMNTSEKNAVVSINQIEKEIDVVIDNFLIEGAQDFQFDKRYRHKSDLPTWVNAVDELLQKLNKDHGIKYDGGSLYSKQEAREYLIDIKTTLGNLKNEIEVQKEKLKNILKAEIIEKEFLFLSIGWLDQASSLSKIILYSQWLQIGINVFENDMYLRSCDHVPVIINSLKNIVDKIDKCMTENSEFKQELNFLKICIKNEFAALKARKVYRHFDLLLLEITKFTITKHQISQGH